MFPDRKDKGFWLRLGGTILALALCVFLLRDQNWNEIARAFQSIAPWRLVVVVLLTFASRFAVTMRWHVLLRAAHEMVSFRQSLRLTFAGLFASNFLPTTVGGDMVRLAGAVQVRMDASVSTASLVADRLVGMAGMLLPLPWGLAGLAQVGLPALAAPLSKATPGASGANGTFATAGVAGWIRTVWNKMIAFTRKTLANFGLWMRHPGALGMSFFFTCVHMFCLFTSIWLLLEGMGETISWIEVAGIWSLVYFITLMPVSVNGYGLQEISATLLYVRLGGLSIEASVTIAVLVRTLQMLTSLPGAFFVGGILAARQEKPSGVSI